MSDELKPCAHCGSDYEVEEWRHADWTDWRVVCGRCGANTDWYISRDAAIAAWNTRANDGNAAQGLRDLFGIWKSDELADDADSRERLEADVRQRSIRPSTQIDCSYDDVMRWLDRQAAITERETVKQWEEQASELVYKANVLTAERDSLREDCSALDKRCIALEEQVDYLTAERDELRKERSRWHVEQVHAYGNWEDVYEYAKKLEAERDELRDKLDEKQHVCDVQRDSFAKMERECAELRRMLADAAEAI